MREHVFALWITGLPASGKSVITASLVEKLNRRTVFPAVLESDRMRRILTPDATYDEPERDRFYKQLVDIGDVLLRSGVPVIFDATGNRRAYRERARSSFSRFVEVYVNSPLQVCESRDPKGIYAAARAGTSKTVPGVQSLYEPPVRPEIVVDGTQPPGSNAELILDLLAALRYI